jgi:DNA-binding NarL/FixJ family response regulator
LRSAADRCGELRAAINDLYLGGEQHTPFPEQLASLLAVHRAIATRDLREVPRAQALVLSANLDRAETARAIVAGGAGAPEKTVDLGQVVDAIRRLRAGQTLLGTEEVAELFHVKARSVA